MMIQRNKISWFDLGNYIFLTFIFILMIYPFIYVFSISISDPQAVFRKEVIFLPKGINFRAYSGIFSSNALLIAFKNTVIYAGLGTLFTLIVSVVGAYPLSEPRFRYRNHISLLLALTMFFQPGLIPRFLVFNSYGLTDSMWVMILPTAFNFWYIILVRANIQMIPRALKESARIDGANDFQILYRVVVPLIMPILATVALFSAVTIWNDFFTPLIFFNDSSKFPLTLVLQRILIGGSTAGLGAGSAFNIGEQQGLFRAMKMATIIATAAPILLLYPFLQRYFTRGIFLGSVKG